MITADDIFYEEREFQVSLGQQQYLEFLVHGSCFDAERYDYYRYRIRCAEEMEEDEYRELFRTLEQNQLDPVTSGNFISQKNLDDHFRNFLPLQKFDMIETIIYRKDGITQNQPVIDNVMKHLPKDGVFSLKIESRQKKTLQQLAYWHAILLPYVQKGLYDAGFDEVKTTKHAQAVLEALFFRKEITNGSETIMVNERLSGQTKEELSTKIDAVKKWASEYLSIYIPSPGEQTNLL